MSKAWRVSLVVAIGITILFRTLDGHAQKASAAAAKAEQEVRTAVMDFEAAYNSNNVEKYFSYYAPDLNMWWPGGRRVDRETYHKSWAEGVEKGGGVSSGEVADLQIQVAPAGDAAVTSYLLKVKRKGVPPERVEAEYQMSPTFFKRDDTWQVVHLQFSMRTPPASSVAAAPAKPAARRSAGTKAEMELRDLIRDFVAAYGTNNVDKYFSYYADDLTWWGPSGRNTKEAYHKSWAEGVKGTGGLASANFSDLRIQVSPASDLAVASYLLSVKRNNPNPPTRTEFVSYEMSPTLVKRDGTWKVVHLHFQIAPEAKPIS
jgi:ketosteroid isomerase-like protein